jgi:hypothetical protein
MAINFPDSPSTNDTVTQGDLTWIWDGTVWKLTVATALAPAGSDTQVQFKNSSSAFAGDADFCFDGTRLLLKNTDDVDLDAVSGSLITGGDGTGQHLAFDSNEIMSKSDATTAADLHLQTDGGKVYMGNNTKLDLVSVKCDEFLVNASTDVTPDSNWDGHLNIQGNGYQGGIALDGSRMWVGHNSASRALSLATNETSRLYITGSAGYVYVGSTGGADFPGTDGFFSIKSSTIAAAFYRTTSASTNDLIYGLSDYSATGTKHFQVENDGDVDNTNNSYGSLSDERLKENIVNPRDYYEDLRKLEVKNFNMCKAVKVDYDVDANGEIDLSTKKVSLVDTHADSRKKMLGLIAQPTETVMQGLVKTDEDGYKHIRYSVLVPMLLQAVQKLADKVEALESA